MNCRPALGRPVLSRYAVRFGRARDLVGVDSLREASAVVVRARDAHEARGKGSSTFPRVTVLDGSTLSVVATVSWNGKVWAPSTWTPGTKPLFDPAEPLCPCGCDGRIADHDDRGWGPWPCPGCGDDSDRDLGLRCSDCAGPAAEGGAR